MLRRTTFDNSKTFKSIVAGGGYDMGVPDKYLREFTGIRNGKDYRKSSDRLEPLDT